MVNRMNEQSKLSDFRQNADEHLDRLNESGAVEELTVNGESRGVVMATATYEALMREVELARSLTMLDAGMDDVKAGRGKDLRQAVRDIADSLNLDLDR